MWRHHSRRVFLKVTAGCGAVFGLGDWAKLAALSPATPMEARVTADLVRFRPEIEPLVRLIEDTPGEKCPAMAIGQLRGGVPYRQFLAALFLAAIRSGAYDHNVFVIHSAQQLALDIPVQERLLPMFWALNSFKDQQGQWKSQQMEQRQRLSGTLPSAAQAESEFYAGMEAWDDERAGWALIALARAGGVGQVIERLWRYAARDWRYIGHLAIWVSNTWRALETLGWEHAEPALRNTVFGLLSQGKSDLADQSYPGNLERVGKVIKKLPADWAARASAEGFTKELLMAWRGSCAGKGTSSGFENVRDDACELAVNHLAAGKHSAGSIWDAVHLAAAESIMYAQKNSTPLHASTAANALHYAFEASADPQNRLLILLQALGWMFHFRKTMSDFGWIREPLDITSMEGEKSGGTPDEAAAQILASLSFGPDRDPKQAIQWYGIGPEAYCQREWLHGAARKAFSLAKVTDGRALVAPALRLLPMKAQSDPHRIKFPIAMLENARWVSPGWRPHVLAASVFAFQGSDAPDTPLMHQIREAVRSL